MRTHKQNKWIRINESSEGGKKYEITDDTKEVDGHILHRIRALRVITHDFPDYGDYDVEKGDLGGWIESEDNLPQEGECWVDQFAMLYENAKVYGDAWLCQDAQVYGNAKVYGNSQIMDNAEVYGNAKVYGNSQIMENAKVYGNASVYGNALVMADAQVYGNAQVNGDSEIYGDSKITVEDNEKDDDF